MSNPTLCHCRGYGWLHPRREDGTVNYSKVVPCVCGNREPPAAQRRPASPAGTGMMASDRADYPCSTMFRQYFLGRDGLSQPERRVSAGESGTDAGCLPGLATRVQALERDRNTLFALSAMRSAAVAELAQRRRRPRGEY